jgi:lipopolysaccharide/colanic/teichoic acid biosynthesis glycosyltransferase
MLGVDRCAVVKRTMDIVVATLALLLLAPLMLLIALLIVVDSPGPVFYRAERIGRGRRPLRMLKFRKMHEGAVGLALTTSGDCRLTRVGAVLVRTRLDELPQLWHVLRGDMSFVGPRPEDPAFVARWEREYDEILRVRPGLTGWTQVAFADEARILGPEDPLTRYVEAILPQKVQLDRLYAVHPSPSADMRILAATFRTVVLQQPIAVHRATGAMSRRRRPVAATLAPAPQSVAAAAEVADQAVVAEAPVAAA